MRVDTKENGIYDITYMSIWQWLKWRFGKSPYVKNVDRTRSRLSTYEPLLYEDKYEKDERGNIVKCINQKLPRHSMNYERKENWV